MTRRSLFALLLAPVLWPVRKVLGRETRPKKPEYVLDLAALEARGKTATEAHLEIMLERDRMVREGILRRLETKFGTFEYIHHPSLGGGLVKRRPRR